MQLEIDEAEPSRAQRTYARLAGVLFLALMVFAIGGGSILSHVAGSGAFGQRAARIAASGTYIEWGFRYYSL